MRRTLCGLLLSLAMAGPAMAADTWKPTDGWYNSGLPN